VRIYLQAADSTYSRHFHVIAPALFRVPSLYAVLLYLEGKIVKGWKLYVCAVQVRIAF